MDATCDRCIRRPAFGTARSRPRRGCGPLRSREGAARVGHLDLRASRTAQRAPGRHAEGNSPLGVAPSGLIDRDHKTPVRNQRRPDTPTLVALVDVSFPERACQAETVFPPGWAQRYRRERPPALSHRSCPNAGRRPACCLGPSRLSSPRDVAIVLARGDRSPHIPSRSTAHGNREQLCRARPGG